MKPSPHPAPLHADRRRWLATGTALAGGALLAACGGGGDVAEPEDGTRKPLGGVDSGGTGMVPDCYVSAAAAGVAPLVAGGVVFGTQIAQAFDGDGLPMPVSAILPGMSCRIVGSQTAATAGGGFSSTALTVRVGEELLGAVTSIDAAAQRVAVLGQTVLVTAATVFDAALAGGLAAAQPGQVLRIWGQPDPVAVRVVATRIAPVAAVSAWVLRGVVNAVDRATGRLTVGGVVLFGSGSAGWPQGLVAGEVVRVRLLPGSQAITSVVRDALSLPDAAQAKIEGRVTAVASATRFAVDGLSVDAGQPGVEFEGSPLVLGAKASVQGRAEGGVLIAREVEIEAPEPQSLRELEGRITSAAAATQSFMLRGVRVVWSATGTRFTRGRAQQLVAGRHVAVKGRASVDGLTVQALQIQIED
jgi:hypothetical protein